MLPGMAIRTELTLRLENSPGALARLCAGTGGADPPRAVGKRMRPARLHRRAGTGDPRPARAVGSG